MAGRTGKRRESFDDETRLVRCIDNEYQLFSYKMKEKTPQEIFDSCNQIQFYSCIWEYFQWIERIQKDVVDALKKEVSPICILWNYYLKQEYLRVITWSDIEELLSAYVQDYKKSERCE